MKTAVFISVLFLSGAAPFTSFGQNQAMDDQRKAFEKAKPYMPKTVSPSSSIYLKAKINGKDWEASKLTPDPDASNLYHVSAENGGVSIAFYVLTEHMHVGSSRKFREGNVADFGYPDNIVFYGGETGGYTVTKVDDDGFEISFHFTATNEKAPANVFEVSDGTLRFPFPKKR